MLVRWGIKTSHLPSKEAPLAPVGPFLLNRLDLCHNAVPEPAAHETQPSPEQDSLFKIMAPTKHAFLVRFGQSHAGSSK
jgi:hypothetical protein